MNGVKEWAAVICLAALSAAMLQSLMPNGPMERMAKFVIGAFILCALIAPISKAVPQIRVGLESDNRSAVKNDALSSTVDQQLQDAAQHSITTLVRSELKQMGVNCKNVQVKMDTKEDGSISINKVIVTVDGKTVPGHAGLSSALGKKLGIQTEVVSDES